MLPNTELHKTEFSKTRKFTRESFKQIEHLTANLANDRVARHNFLFNSLITLISDYSGEDSNGNQLQATIKIPNEITNPKEYDLSDYPLAEDESFFKQGHKYDYLVTFRAGSLTNTYEPKTKMYKLHAALDKLMHVKQRKSRFADLWRELCTVIASLDVWYQTTNYPLRTYVKLLFHKGDEFPFYESPSQDKIIFNDKSVASILPTFVYTCCQVGTAIMSGVLTHVESIVAMNNFLHCAKDSYIDEKLKIKGIGRSWYQEALHNVGQVTVPVWSQFNEVIGHRMKNTSEPHFVSATFTALRAKRAELLYPEFNDYINRALRLSKTQNDVANYYAACRAMTNDGTFLATLTELSLDAAVFPRIEQRLVTRPAVLMSNARHESLRQKYINGVGSIAQSYLSSFTDEVARRVNGIHHDEAWLNFLTTSSPGRKLTEIEKLEVGGDVAAWSNSRIVMQAVFAREYRTPERIFKSLKAPIKLVERQQSDRRQRAISGLDNDRLFLSFMPYTIGKQIYDLNDNAAQGKQAGNAFDIGEMLYWTSQRNVLLSSIDVAGMDASVTTNTKDIYNTFVLDVASKCTVPRFGPYYAKNMEVFEVGKRQSQVKYVNAAWQACALEAANSQTSTSYESEIFGQVKNAEGTYPSGRADTSTHHTVLLQGLVRGNELKRASDGKNSCLTTIKILGDDIMEIFQGSQDDTHHHAVSNANILNESGFATTAELSQNSIVLLQQLVVNGTFWGFADRISLWTREDTKDIGRLNLAMMELNALLDDLLFRVRRPEGLKMLGFFCGAICLRRFTLSVDNNLYDSTYDHLSKYMTLVKYDKNPDFDSTLMSLILPLTWLFMPKGGEYPAYPFERRDGTFTEDESMFTARGAYKRRLLYDVSNIREMIQQNSVALDDDLLHEYGFTGALLLIDLNILDLIDEVKKEDISPVKVSELATSLEQLGKLGEREKSRRAASDLKVRGYALSNDIVYGYGLQEKIQKSAMATKETTVQSKRISLRLHEVIVAKTRDYKIPTVPADALHLYEFEVEDVVMDLLPHAKHTSYSNLAYNMSFGSDSWFAFALLGGLDRSANLLRLDVASIRGNYHKFSYDDPVFKQGYKIYKSDATLLDDFFTAISAGPKEQGILLRAFAYYSLYGNVEYHYVLSPRQLFFLSDNPVSAERLVRIPPSYYVSTQCRALYNIFSYLHILRSIASHQGKRLKMVLHPGLIAYVRGTSQSAILPEADTV
uniref:RNA-directed RNA polymerase n=1 Tax=Lymantria dispar cypovirus 1 TaxID=165803 RepID=A0A6M3N0J7_LDCPV|nr:RNA-dependent RNA polymerase [Lymantria dispar cypovirus 1]